MPPPSANQQKVLIAQFVSLTGQTERQATRVTMAIRPWLRMNLMAIQHSAQCAPATRRSGSGFSGDTA
ncbi:hypothetical protein ACHAPD_000066 [Fusarium lateritium]